MSLADGSQAALVRSAAKTCCTPDDSIKRFFQAGKGFFQALINRRKNDCYFLL